MTHANPEAARLSRLSCIDSNNRWRRQARVVREHAATVRDAKVKADLEGSAASCDAQADWWLRGAIDDQVAASASPAR